MTWNDLETPEEQPIAQQQAEAQRKELSRACRKALDENPALEKYLRGVLRTWSYVPGRDPAQVAHVEGQRTTARVILQLGDKLDG